SSIAPPRPRIIFCTAYDRYAIDAFEHHAVDYLLKPLKRERLARALDGVRETLGAAAARRREISEAAAAQASMLPGAVPTLRRLEIRGMCRPAGGIGGDAYDFLAVGDGGLALTIGDVSGKGVYAGVLMAALQARLRALA